MMETLVRLPQGRWPRLALTKFDSRVWTAVLAVGVLGAVASGANLLKDLVSAAVYGPGDALDAFLVAFALPLFVINVAAGSFGAELIPTYVRARRLNGQTAARNVLAGSITVSVSLLFLTVALLALTGPSLLTLLGSGFSPAKAALTQRMFYVLLPIIVLSGLATVYGAILNAEQHFAVVALAALTVPAAAIVAVISGGLRFGIYALAAGTLLGFVLQLSLVAWWLRRQGVALSGRWSGISPEMRQTAIQYLPLIAAGVLVNRGVLVDQAMAAMLSPGSVTALTLGGKIVAVVQGLGASAVRTAVLPHFSGLVAEHNWLALRRTLRTYTTLIVIASLPLMLALSAFATPLVGVLFQRGAFTSENTHLVGHVQAMSVLQIPFFIMLGLVAPLMSALRANTYLMKAALIALPLNLLLDYVLMGTFGVAGIAIATAAVSAASWAYLAGVGYRLIRRLEAADAAAINRPAGAL